MRPGPLVLWGSILVLLGSTLGVWVFVRGNTPLIVDAAWNDFLESARSPAVETFALVMSFLGGGWFGILLVPLGGAIVLFLLRRPWSAAFFLVAQAASAGVVQVLKQVLGRARPEDILIFSDFGSFPSGHTAGAATLAVATAVVVGRRWVVAVGVVWVVLMAFTRTYLHAHWLSDTVGGALLGVGVGLLVAATFARLFLRERKVLPAEVAAP